MESKNKHTVRKDEWMQPYKKYNVHRYSFLVVVRHHSWCVSDMLFVCPRDKLEIKEEKDISQKCYNQGESSSYLTRSHLIEWVKSLSNEDNNNYYGKMLARPNTRRVKSSHRKISVSFIYLASFTHHSGSIVFFKIYFHLSVFFFATTEKKSLKQLYNCLWNFMWLILRLCKTCSFHFSLNLQVA